MNRIEHICTDTVAVVSNFLLRSVAVVAFVCVIYFPIFKNNLLGFVPVAIGFGLAFRIERALRDKERDQSRGILPVLEALSDGRFVLLLLLPVAIFQLVALLYLQPIPLSDPLFVLREARALVETGRMSEITYYPPLPIWWYAFFFKLLGDNDLVAQMSLILLSSGMTYLNYRVATKLLPRKVHARFVAILFAIYPGNVIYILATPGYFYHYTFSLVLLTLCFIRATEKEKGYQAMGIAGIVAGIGALAKPVLLIAPAQLFIPLFYLAGSFLKRSLWVRLFALFVGFGIALAPWVYRNYKVFNSFVPVCTYGPLTFYSANNEDSNGLYSRVADDIGASTPEQMLALGRLSNEKAMDWIMANPSDFLALSLRKVLYTWGNEATFAELINARGHQIPVIDLGLSALLQTGWSCAVLLWVIAVWRGLRSRCNATSAFDVLVAVVVVSNFLLYFFFEGGARHHVPLVSLILLYTARQLVTNSDTGIQTTESSAESTGS